MSADPFLRGKDFLACVDKCHKMEDGKEPEWEILLECLEECWRRNARP